jgi:hypothetical protein
MPKNIILCFDGTGNDPEDSVQSLGFAGSVEDDNITNVLKLHLLFGGDLKTKAEPGGQMSFYYSGVGTYGSWFDKLRNKLRAPEDEDVASILRRSIQDLFKHHEPGDRLYVFGFSRGAAIARRFASILSQTFPALGREKPSITFLGVFDTVAAINRPNLFKEEVKPASDVVFENRTLSPLIQEALHLLSLDERRTAFLPTLINRQDNVTEVWFPGAHSDVGGGFHYDGLADQTLQFMLDWLMREHPELQILTPEQVPYEDLFDDDEEEVIQYRDVVIHPNYLGRSHQQQAITHIKGAFLSDRTPRVNVNEKQSVFPPMIHHSVFDRMVDDADYDPVPLRSQMLNPYTGEAVKFQVWYSPGHVVTYDALSDAKLAAQHHPQRLAVGEAKTFVVYANQKYSASRVLVKKGDKYRFSIDLAQLWCDGGMPATPAGWKKKAKKDLAFYEKVFIKAAQGRRRHPDAEWFEVILTVNRSDDDLVRPLQVTGDKVWTADSDGELYGFPNDLESKYDNNLGSISVSVTRVK